MATLLIIGYGNPLRCDDAVGWLAADRLLEHYDGDDRVEVIPCQQLTPELAPRLAEAQAALFLDASATGAPGTLTRQALAPPDDTTLELHDLDPQALLGLAKQLYGHAPATTLLTVSGELFDHGEMLSDAVEQGLERMVQAAEEWVEERAQLKK